MSPRAMISAMACLLALLATAAWSAERLTSIEGETTAVNVRGIRDGVVHTADGNAWPLAEVRRIARPIKVTPFPLRVQVRLHDGGELQADRVEVLDGSCRIITADGAFLTLALDAIRAIVFVREPMVFKAVEEQLAADAPTDRLIVAHNQERIVVPGVLLGIDDKSVRFRWNDRDRGVALARVQAVVLPALKDVPAPAGRIRLRLRGDMTLWADSIELAGDRVTAKTIGGDVRLAWGMVWRIEPCGPRLVFLSDLEPLAVEQQSIVTFSAPWRRDRNVLGDAMQLRGEPTYEKGIGTHATCRLEYALGGRFERFLVTIGIDESTHGKGDCIFVVAADDRELTRVRVRGGDAPRDLSLDMTGVRRLTLAVEAGEELDLADRANWADARLILAKGR